MLTLREKHEYELNISRLRAELSDANDRADMKERQYSSASKLLVKERLKNIELHESIRLVRSAVKGIYSAPR